jgi:hypothetical protein
MLACPTTFYSTSCQWGRLKCETWTLAWSLSLWRMTTFVSWCAVQKTTISGWTKSQRNGSLRRGMGSERGSLWWIRNNWLLSCTLSHNLSHINRHLRTRCVILRTPELTSYSSYFWRERLRTAGETRVVVECCTIAPYFRYPIFKSGPWKPLAC